MPVTLNDLKHPVVVLRLTHLAAHGGTPGSVALLPVLTRAVLLLPPSAVVAARPVAAPTSAAPSQHQASPLLLEAT